MSSGPGSSSGGASSSSTGSTPHPPHTHPQQQQQQSGPPGHHYVATTTRLVIPHQLDAEQVAIILMKAKKGLQQMQFQWVVLNRPTSNITTHSVNTNPFRWNRIRHVLGWTGHGRRWLPLDESGPDRGHPDPPKVHQHRGDPVL